MKKLEHSTRRMHSRCMWWHFQNSRDYRVLGQYNSIQRYRYQREKKLTMLSISISITLPARTKRDLRVPYICAGSKPVSFTANRMACGGSGGRPVLTASCRFTKATCNRQRSRKMRSMEELFMILRTALGRGLACS